MHGREKSTRNSSIPTGSLAVSSNTRLTEERWGPFLNQVGMKTTNEMDKPDCPFKWANHHSMHPASVHKWTLCSLHGCKLKQGLQATGCTLNVLFFAAETATDKTWNVHDRTAWTPFGWYIFINHKRSSLPSSIRGFRLHDWCMDDKAIVSSWSLVVQEMLETFNTAYPPKKFCLWSGGENFLVFLNVGLFQSESIHIVRSAYRKSL